MSQDSIPQGYKSWADVEREVEMQMMGSGRTRQRLTRRMTRDEITRVARKHEHEIRKLVDENKKRESDLIKTRQVLAQERQTSLTTRIMGKLRKAFGFEARRQG